MYYILTLLIIVLLIIKTDSYIPSFFQDAINIYQQHQSILPTNIDISYAPPALPLSPLIQPSFDDLRSYAIAVSEILKQDVDSATKIIT